MRMFHGLFAAEAEVTGVPALLIILVIIAIPIALGVVGTKLWSRRKMKD